MQSARRLWGVMNAGGRCSVSLMDCFFRHLQWFAERARIYCLILLGASASQSAELAFFKQHCVQCHNAKRQKGDVRLDLLSPAIDAENLQLWKEVVHNLQRGDMPPEDEDQPTTAEREAFISQLMPLLDRYEADTQGPPDPFMRLTNRQIAHSIQDLLGLSRDISSRLIEDPLDKHGFSRQSELEVSGGYFSLYLPALQDAIADAVPDLSKPPDVYRIAGDEWEQAHFLSTWAMSERSRRNLYRGPKWRREAFEIPLPAQHEYRMYLKDNRPEGDFRICVTVRNEPPTDGGMRTPQQLSVYLDEGFMRPYKAVGHITVAPEAGPQVFELFGNVRDWVGVSLEPFGSGEAKKKEVRRWTSRWRILSVQNRNALSGFPPPVNMGEVDRSGGVYLVRPDDQWIAEFGKLPGLEPSYRGPAGAHPGGKGKTQAIYPDVMKTYAHAVVERIDFELPFHAEWPPPSAKPFLSEGKLLRADLPDKLKVFAARAWRRPLDSAMNAYVGAILTAEFASGVSDSEALRNALAVLLSDPKFLYLSRNGKHPRPQNFERVARLAALLWDGAPDSALTALADQDAVLGDAEIASQVDRLLADPRSERFVESFVALWIGFTAFDQIAIDPNYYPNWRPTLKAHAKQECVAFFRELLQKDESCLNLLDSDFVMVNQRMGEHYGMAGVDGMNFSRAPAPEGRGGVLTQAAVLLAYSNGQDSHAVNRGVWLRARLLGDPPPEPPPEVPALADQDAEAVDGLSITQRLQQHATGVCYDCHKGIDPWGIAMESFDAIGLKRDKILRIGKRRLKLPVVDAVEVDGKSLAGMSPLKAYLRADRSTDFAYGFSRHMLSYALGRQLSYRDEATVRELQAVFEQDGLKM
ncbi:MAG: hypothetical protein ACI8W8_003303, partial [Rhodothermales bacterium]